ARRCVRPSEPGQLLECPTCPPTVAGGLPVRRVLGRSPERRRRAWLGAGPQAPGMAGASAAEAVTQAGPVGLVDDAGRMASELVASALRHTDAPGELTVDAGAGGVRGEGR